MADVIMLLVDMIIQCQIYIGFRHRQKGNPCPVGVHGYRDENVTLTFGYRTFPKGKYGIFIPVVFHLNFQSEKKVGQRFLEIEAKCFVFYEKC